jgi:hypothetical protein
MKNRYAVWFQKYRSYSKSLRNLSVIQLTSYSVNNSVRAIRSVSSSVTVNWSIQSASHPLTQSQSRSHSVSHISVTVSYPIIHSVSHPFIQSQSGSHSVTISQLFIRTVTHSLSHRQSVSISVTHVCHIYSHSLHLSSQMFLRTHEQGVEQCAIKNSTYLKGFPGWVSSLRIMTELRAG